MQDRPFLYSWRRLELVIWMNFSAQVEHLKMMYISIEYDVVRSYLRECYYRLYPGKV